MWWINCQKNWVPLDKWSISSSSNIIFWMSDHFCFSHLWISWTPEALLARKNQYLFFKNNIFLPVRVKGKQFLDSLVWFWCFSSRLLQMNIITWSIWSRSDVYWVFCQVNQSVLLRSNRPQQRTFKPSFPMRSLCKRVCSGLNTLPFTRRYASF